VPKKSSVEPKIGVLGGAQNKTAKIAVFRMNTAFLLFLGGAQNKTI